jgi:hypothetical protein
MSPEAMKFEFKSIKSSGVKEGGNEQRATG